MSVQNCMLKSRCCLRQRRKATTGLISSDFRFLPLARNTSEQIESIFPTGSNDVYVVKDIRKDQEKETLIPALESVVLNIDFDKKTMRVLLPEGFIETVI